MKLSILKKLLLLLFVCEIFFSCTDNLDSNSDILRQAQSLIEEDPNATLKLLNSIEKPEQMDEEDYMNYILMHVATKKEMEQNISQDILIHTAKKYFKENNKIDQLAEASFYTAWVSYQNDNLEDAMKNWLEAEILASKINNHKLAGRSANNVASLFYTQDILSSSIIYYKKALEHYKKLPNSDLAITKIINSLGLSYEETGQLDIAHQYFVEALEIAIEKDYKKYETKIKNNIGLIFLKKENYKEAVKYFNDALHSSTDITEDATDKINLNLARVYNKTQQTDSAKYYTSLVESSISQSSDKFYLKGLYFTFSWHYEQIEDYEKALYYAQLENEMKERIAEENRAEELYRANMNLHIERKDESLEKSKAENNLFLFIAIGVISLIILASMWIIYATRHSSIKNLKDTDDIKNKYQEKIDSLITLQNTYISTLTELLGVDKTNSSDVSKNKISETKKPIVAMMREKSNEQLIIWIKHILNDLFPNKVLTEDLKNEYILLLFLLFSRYPEKDITLILNITVDDILLQKIELASFFQAKGLTEPQIKKILYPKEEISNKHEQ